MKTNFSIPVKFVFTGEFTVRAESVYQAMEIVHRSCGMNCGEIHSSLPDDEVEWEFDMTPEKFVFPEEKEDDE